MLTDDKIRYIAKRVAEECNKSPDNIPLDEIEEAFEGETEGKEGCSSMTTPAPPARKAGQPNIGVVPIKSFLHHTMVSSVLAPTPLPKKYGDAHLCVSVFF